MRSGSLGSRVALAALCAASTTLAAPPADAQSTPLATRGPAGVADRSSLATKTPAGPSPAMELGAPDDPPPLMRGPVSEMEPAVSIGANYGRPVTRARAPKPYPRPRPPSPPPFSPKNPLPPLEPYRTSGVARQALRLRPTNHPGAPAAQPPVTVAVPPTIKVKPKPKAELNPFDPLGVPVGSTLVYPYVQTNGGYDDNPNRLAPQFNPRASSFFRGEGGLKVKSDWDRHSLQGELRGGYSEYFDYPAASRPDATGQFTGRYDVTHDTALDLLGRLSLDTMRPGAPAISPGQATVFVVNRPIILGMGTQAGATQKFGRLDVSLRGTYDRVWYQDAQYSNGTTLNLAETSYNDYGVLLRAAYEATPDVKPFVEGTYDKRVHDSPTDFNGFYRDSAGFIIRGGADVNITQLVRGEVSGGYGQRNYADWRLPPLRGPRGRRGADLYALRPDDTDAARNHGAQRDDACQCERRPDARDHCDLVARSAAQFERFGDRELLQ